MNATPILVAVLLAVLGTACGGVAADVEQAVPPAAGACLAGAEDCADTGGDMGVLPPDTPVSEPAGPSKPDPGQSDTPAAERIEPTEGLVAVHPVDWERVEVAPDDPSQVTVYWTSGVPPCYAFAGVEVTETDEVITLTVTEGHPPTDEPQACIEIAKFKSAIVTLDEPVGARSIIDGGQA